MASMHTKEVDGLMTQTEGVNEESLTFTPKIPWFKNRQIFRHLSLCFKFFFFKVVILTLDVATDFVTALNHFSDGNKNWALLTLVPIFLPFVVKFVSVVIGQGRNWLKLHLFMDNLMQLLLEAPTCLPILQTLRNLRILIGLFVTDTSLPQNSVVVNKLKLQASESGIFEAFLEAAPQFILQCYIIFQTGQTTVAQSLGMSISFLSLSFSSLTMFFTQRIGRYPDTSPTLKMKMMIFPFIIFQLLGPLFSLVLMSLYYREYIFVCIFSIVAITTALLWLIYDPSEFKELYPASELFKRRRIEDVRRIILTSGLTSWISTCSVLSRNYQIKSNFLIISSVLSHLCHIFCISSIFILMSVENAMDISRYPFTHCFNESILSEYTMYSYYLSNVSYLFKTVQVAKQYENINHTKFILRICDENENPTDLYYKWLGPVAFVLIIISFASSLCLQRLGDYSCWLFKRAKCIHFTVFQDFTNDGQDIEALEKYLNNDALNRGDPLEGETLIHCWGKRNVQLREIGGFLKCIAENGADPTIENIYGQTPAFFMIPKLVEDLESAIKLNNESKVNLNKTAKKVWEKPPMHFLSQNNDICFAILLLIGGQLFSQDAEGNTVILKVFENDNQKNKILRKLMHWEIDRESKYIQATLFLAAERGMFNLLEFLIQTKAVQQGKEASVNMTNNFGQTAIHLATKAPHLNCIKILLDNGANPDVKDGHGMTQLHHTSQCGLLGIVKCLVSECNADVNIKDNNDGRTALHYACDDGHLDVVKYLVKEGKADLNMNDNDGHTPLHFASRDGDLDVVKYLVKECKADVNLKNNFGQTPLHFAAEKEHSDVVKWLVNECNADINARDIYCQKPINVSGYEDIKSFLANVHQ